MTTKTKAAGFCGNRAALKSLNANFTTPRFSARLIVAGRSPEAAKRAAIFCYCHGALSLEACAFLFRRYPEWLRA